MTTSQAISIKIIEFEIHDCIIKVEWRTASRWKNIPWGSTSCTITQCIVSMNNFIIATSHAEKDSREENNKVYAMKITAAKAFKSCTYQLSKKTREKFWETFFNETKQNAPQDV